MEALACRDGLKLAVQLGLRRVQLESDCLQVVQLWKRKDMQRSILDPILKEMEEISFAFHDFSFSHTPVLAATIARAKGQLLQNADTNR